METKALSKNRKKSVQLPRETQTAPSGRAADIIKQSMSVLDLINDAIIAKSLDGTITLWNPAAERMLGYSAHEIMGRSTLILFPSDRAKEEEEIHDRAMKGENVRSFETVFLRKDGRPLDVSVTVSPLKNETGKIIGSSKILRDLTEFNRISAGRGANRPARQNPGRHCHFRPGRPGPSFGTRRRNVFTVGAARNRRAVLWAISFFRRAEIQGSKRAYSARRRMVRRSQTPHQGARGVDCRDPLVTAAGQFRWPQVGACDQHRRHGKEEDRSPVHAGAAHGEPRHPCRRNRARSQQHSHADHAFHRHAQEPVGRYPYQVDPRDHRVERPARLRHRAAGARLCPRHEGQRIVIQPKYLLKDIEHIVTDTFPKDIRLNLTLPHETWTILGDPTQVQQVLLNLCVNARDAMPNGGTLSIKTENCLADENYVAMKPAGQDRRLRGDFRHRHRRPASRRTSSTRSLNRFLRPRNWARARGLGLSSVKAIVKNHGGFIDVYSELNRGTTFKVYLPAQQATCEVPDQAKEDTSLPRGSGEMIPGG